MAVWPAVAIIDLVFIPIYGILLILNVFNVFKHGFSKVAGYLSLLIVCALKITGDSLLVVTENGSSQSVDVAVWGLILSQLGFLPLIAASSAFIIRWIGTWRSADPRLDKYTKILRLLALPMIAGTICAIIAGTDSAPGDSSIDTGFTLRRVSAIIFLVLVLIIMFLAYSLYAGSRTPEQKNDLVLVQVLIVTPIMLLRIIYAVVQSFLSTPTNPGRNTWVYLALLMIPDAVAVAIYTVCGFMVQKADPAVTDYYSNRTNIEAGKVGGDQGNLAGGDYTAQPQNGRRRGRRQGGYRPRGPITFLIFTIIDLFKKDDEPQQVPA